MHATQFTSSVPPSLLDIVYVNIIKYRNLTYEIFNKKK